MNATKTKTIPMVTIKNYKSLNTHDGVAFSATIYIDGREEPICNTCEHELFLEEL